MSRSSHQRQQQKLQQQQQLLAQQQQMADNDAAAAAAEMFDLFCVATTMRQVLGLHRNMCDLVGLRPSPLNEFYPKLKAKIRSWKGQALWKKLDARAAHRAYAKGNACTGTRVLVIGAGPCGLRTAIEAQLLGAKVVVVEKRDRISRNNVLHLWPFVITDLRNLGAKKFYGKFCAGSIDHISIRQLQYILLKVALLLGVEVHEGVSFDGTIEPNGDGCGWRAEVAPADHAVSHYEFDVLIGADGKRNTLEGFKRKEFRGKLAIAITANFINKKTEAEAKAEEISGVAFIFNQPFFKEFYQTTGIDLENIVYYKDETHYFVMTAKKHSLIDKGVIMQDFADPAELLAPVNVNTEKLLDYAREAAEFSTKYQMPNLEFAVNHYGKPDVAMFDFTSMFAAETSCRVIVRKGFRLLQCLVGDSLLEPFWPTGSGCARGFLSSMDAAYAIKLWSNAHNSTLAVLAQRESIYRLLNQTTPENLQRDIGSYTVDPATRYPNLNRTSVNVWQVKHLIDTDDNAILEQTFVDTNALQATQVDTPVRRKRRSGDSMPLSAVLLRWICAQLHSYEFTRSLKEVSDVFTNGKVLCALINRYRPDLVDFNAIQDSSAVECNELAFQILDKELNIPRIMSGKDSTNLNTVESKVWLNYLEQICEVFRGEIPHVKHPKMDFTDLREKYRFHSTTTQPDFSKLLQLSTKQKSKSPSMQDMVDVPQVVAQRRSVLDEEKLKRQRKHGAAAADVGTVAAAATSSAQPGQTDTPRRAKKRRSAEKAANIEERQKRLQEIEVNRQDRQSKRRQQRYQQTQNFYKSLHMLQANTLLRESDDASPFEDYSIFMYRQQAPEFNDRVKDLERKLLYPDRERLDVPSAMPRNVADEQFSDRIKSMEQRISSRQNYGTDKKPKDLMRAIGKIDSSDWNVREIEKKIEQSKKTEIHGPKGREKVPKWSKEQFMARQNKMSKPMRQDSGEEKFKEIDQTLKNLDKQLKEGSVLEVGERGRNKVASIAGQFVKKDDTSDEKNPPTVVPKSSTKVALAFKKQAASEKCHFCKQTVYLMEKITTEGLILHRLCLKCHHCHTNLRPGGYAFDRDDPNGRFYCTQHFRLPAKAIRPVVRKPGQRKPTQQQQQAIAAVSTIDNVPSIAAADGVEPKTPEKLRGHADTVAQFDLLDRGQTPERIEFENNDAISDGGEPSEEHILDENEWSGRNFLPESNNDSESDMSSSDDSESDSDSDMFEEANDSPLGVQTLQLATDWIGKQNYSDSDDSDDFYDSSDGMADDGKDDTEGEEFKKARELRREEVRLLPLPANLPTDTETELKLKNENTQNSAETITIQENELPQPIQISNVSLDKTSDKSLNSENSFVSAESIVVKPQERAFTTTKADMEKLEQNSDHKFSAEIEEISEKLYRMNNMMKMTKDLEILAKDNLVKSDILKKLTLKEQWLANNSVGNMNTVSPKSDFDTKLEKLAKVGENVNTAPKSNTNDGENKMDVVADAAQEQFKEVQPSKKLEQMDVAKEASQNVEELKSSIDLEKMEVVVAANEDVTAMNVVAGETPETTKNADASLVVAMEAQGNTNVSKNTNQLETMANIIPEHSEKPSIANAVETTKKLPKGSQEKLNLKENIPQDVTQKQEVSEMKGFSLTRTSSLKKSVGLSPLADRKNASTATSRSNSFKSNASTSPKMTQKSSNLSRSNSLKKPVAMSSNKMQIENILDIVKKIDISGGDKKMDTTVSEVNTDADKDIGRMLYDAENRFSPKPNKRMSAKLKEIEATSFAGTMDNIKSQMVMPTVSTQAAAGVDLSKYFPNQKQEKSNSAALNKNQKTLKDVDLTKYFPSSPGPQKRTVVTVAEKLKKSQTEASLAPAATTSKTATTTIGSKKVAPKRQASLGSATFSLREHQLDGAVDIAKKKSPVVTTIATATANKKGTVKIIKKMVPKGTKARKLAEIAANEKALLSRDESDRILDEILDTSDKDTRSPSLEYKKLFDEEKSPSEDISDKIERILEETGIDLGIPRKEANVDNRKKLLKTKSLGEGEFERHDGKLSQKSNESLAAKEDGDRPRGVQNILKRFESMSSVKSEEHAAFKLQRMESSTSNLNKSRDSLVSRDSLSSLSDLEKTMDYLKSEWRSEATNFLQKKRNVFFEEKRSREVEAAAVRAEQQKNSRYDDLPVQYRESKLAKFFGIKQKSPERKKSPIKKKSPVKTKPVKTNSPEKNKPTEKNISTEMKKSAETVKSLQKPKISDNKIFPKTKSPEKKISAEKKISPVKIMSPEKSITKGAAPTQKKESTSQIPLNSVKTSQEVINTIPVESNISKSSDIISRLEEKIKLRRNSADYLLNEAAINVPQNSTSESVKQDENKSDVIARIEERIKSRKNSIINSADATNIPTVESNVSAKIDNISNEILENKQGIENISTKLNSTTENLSKSSEISTKEVSSEVQTTCVNSGPSTPLENSRPLVEDIKNLPKFGCDKSQSNSRRGSQTSLQSRRHSDVSLSEKFEIAANELARNSQTLPDTNVDDIFNEMFKQLDAPLDESENVVVVCKDERDSTRSMSSSVPPITVKLRGSSEDESIEKLFGEFEDNMLVDVEFDSNDELIAITPHSLIQPNIEGTHSVDDDRDFLDELESLEKDPDVVEENVALLTNHETNTDNQNQIIKESLESQFPIRPQRRQKSSSSSSEPTGPIAPQRMKNKLAKLNPTDMPPSVQDLLQEAFSKDPKLDIVENIAEKGLKFPHVSNEYNEVIDDHTTKTVDLSNASDNHIIEKQSPIRRRLSKTSIKSGSQDSQHLGTVNEPQDKVNVISKEKPSTTRSVSSQSTTSTSQDGKPSNVANVIKIDKKTNYLDNKEISNPVDEKPSPLFQRLLSDNTVSILEKEMPHHLADENPSPLFQRLLTDTTTFFVEELVPVSLKDTSSSNDFNNSLADLANKSLSRRLSQTSIMSHSQDKPMVPQILITNVEKDSPHSQRRSSQSSVKYLPNSVNVSTPKHHERQPLTMDSKSEISEAKPEKRINRKDSISGHTKSDKREPSPINIENPSPLIQRLLSEKSELVSHDITPKRKNGESNSSKISHVENFSEKRKQNSIPLAQSEKTSKSREPSPVYIENPSRLVQRLLSEKSTPVSDRIESEAPASQSKNVSEKREISPLYIENPSPLVQRLLAETSKPVSEKLVVNDEPASENISRSDVLEKREPSPIYIENPSPLVQRLLSDKTIQKEPSLTLEEIRKKPLLERILLEPSNKNDRPPIASDHGKSTNNDVTSKIKRRPSMESKESDSSAVFKNNDIQIGGITSNKLNTRNNSVLSSKAQSKEKSLEWDMERMPASPMPRRRFVHAERAPYQEPSDKEDSPTPTIKMLNNLPPGDMSEEQKERRIIEEFEMQRRAALKKRDKRYTATHEPIDVTDPVLKNLSISKTNTPVFTPSNRSPTESRKFDQSSVVTSIRSATPPMCKALVLPSEVNPASEYSRRTSLLSEITEQIFPKIHCAPLPKVLKVPTPMAAVLYANHQDNEPIPECLKNRPWPNRGGEAKQTRSESIESYVDYDNDDDFDDMETLIRKERESRAKSLSPISEVFKNRAWPKANPRTGKVEPADIAVKNKEIDRINASRTVSRIASKLPSPSPPLRRKYQRSTIDSNMKSPFKSTQSLHVVAPRSSQSSGGDTDLDSFMGSRSVEHLSALPQRGLHSLHPNAAVDTGTRLLLDRGKRLRNRKKDFVNERVAERNPYMRNTFDAEKFEREAMEEAAEELESYRPKNHSTLITSTPRKFPTSHTFGRSGSTRYSNASPTYADYDGGSSRRRYTPTLPSSATTPSYLQYPSHTPTYSSSSGRTHLADIFRRSPTQHRDREHSKESRLLSSVPILNASESKIKKQNCNDWVRSLKVQSDSESSSSDKVEQNSATEISTDSEFDNDENVRETPKIFIDDTYLRRPTKVQVKSSIITPSSSQKFNTNTATAITAPPKGGSYLQKYQPHQPLQPQFKPLVQVDPSVLYTNRMPLQNPRPGDYLLNKTASTEGIASKKSLELKKRYLLGEPANGNKIQKSGSTSVLDSKIRSFHSNISECQKLLNPGNDISPSMKTFLDRTKLGEHGTDSQNIMRSKTGDILNDLRVEITIQKASSTASTDNEKENLFVNSKNELNKGMEYSETVNATLLESLSKKSPSTPTNNQTIIETINLVTPEKKIPIIDLTQVEIPPKMLESNVEFINNMEMANKLNLSEKSSQLLNTDSNKIIDLTCESPVKSESTIIEDTKPDVSRDIKECIPDIIANIESGKMKSVKYVHVSSPNGDEQQRLLSNSFDEEKKDSPEKHDMSYEHNDLQIEVPNIPWNKRKPETCSSTSSSCTSNTSSIEDIQHYILESTTSPDTHTACVGHQVPRLEVHDTAGELMQIDSLMVDSKYIIDSDDLKHLDISEEGMVTPELPALRTSEVEDEPDIEPVTATPEPAEQRTVIELEDIIPPLPENGPPLPERGPPKIIPADLKFDTKNENKVEVLKHLPLIVDQTIETQKVIKPLTLNLKNAHKSPNTTPTGIARTPLTPLTDNDKTPTADLFSRGSDSETEATGTGQVFTETELSDWTADDCISENFIDMEFVINSNKGTIKRNKKGKKKSIGNTSKLSTPKETHTNMAPVAEFEGILGTFDIGEIDFMDTGSEGSCAEAYTATNTAMLRNRGYIEFIENSPKTTPSHTKPQDTATRPKTDVCEKYAPPISTKRDEVLGVDYIEQGAYIMQQDFNKHDLLKTPVNESPQLAMSAETNKPQPISNALTQSLTDSSTLNDVDDDSLGLVTPNSQATNTKTTTEESEALTVVTSPLDSSSPKVPDMLYGMLAQNQGDGSTPSSSEKIPKTSLSTCTPSSASATSSSTATSPRHASQEPAVVVPSGCNSKTAPVAQSRKSGDDLSYEEYVRALQQKITQISNARDSLDTRKQRRKSSKGESPFTIFSSDTQTVIEQQARGSGSETQTPPRVDVTATVSEICPCDPSAATAAAQIHKVPEIPTLTRRLEEITKERTKQKDLIHDLVMDKLQSKKQLNAEKRLHRSRQRTMMTSGTGGYTSGSSLSPTPKLAAAATTSDNNCTSQAHYHVSTAANERPISSSSSSFKENTPLQQSPTYVSAYRTKALSPTLTYKQRPFSEHMDSDPLEALERCKLTKTPSFSYAMSTSKRNLNNQPPVRDDMQTATGAAAAPAAAAASNAVFAAPVAPLRLNRGRAPATTAANSQTTAVNAVAEVTPDSTTDKLRLEARARARLKSNNELGLSPEEKMQLLRKRIHKEDAAAAEVPIQQPPLYTKSTAAQHSARNRKMSTSKSVNDLATAAHFGAQLRCCLADVNSNTRPTSNIADFTSDPNLLLSSTSAEAAVKPLKGGKSSSRRQKDPERRKSIIQSLSNFFHMGNGGGGSSGANGGNKKDSSSAGTTNTASAANSAQPERPGTSGSSTTTNSGSVDGVFSRFRISSKTKEKSKDKDGYAVNTTSSNTATTAQYERSSSQDCIVNTKNQHYNHNNNNSRHNTKHHHHTHGICAAHASTTYSSSSPQLFVAKANAAAAAGADEQTPPPIPPLPLHYQRSDDESYATETREQKKQRSISKAVRQAELKRLRIAQEIQREQEEIEVQLKELEARGVLIEKALRGEGQHVENFEAANAIGASDEKLLKELLEIWRNITQLKKRDEELGIRQKELQLEHRHAQLKEELNIRLSSSKLDKSSADVAAEGAILNEMLEIVSKRAALRPTANVAEPESSNKQAAAATAMVALDIESAPRIRTDSVKLNARGQSLETNESQI